jgi:biopolymer transport protein ExbD
MKFQRNARIFKGQLDAAPFATVFFLLVVFLMLESLVYTPGVRITLPMAGDLPGTDKPTVAVGIDANGRLYFENQGIDEAHLKEKLRAAAIATPGLNLLIEADESVPQKRVIQLSMLAREAGITEGSLATLPRAVAAEP